ncbi:hypothetical protein FQZ97_1038520 [compost metagenome]
MRRAEGVVFAFLAARKTADAALLAQAVHALAAAGEDLVRVGLVAHVPDQAVLGGVEHVVQRHGEFHRAQVGAEVAAGLGHTVDHEGPQFIGQRMQLRTGELAQIGRRFNGRQK